MLCGLKETRKYHESSFSFPLESIIGSGSAHSAPCSQPGVASHGLRSPVWWCLGANAMLCQQLLCVAVTGSAVAPSLSNTRGCLSNMYRSHSRTYIPSVRLHRTLSRTCTPQCALCAVRDMTSIPLETQLVLLPVT